MKRLLGILFRPDDGTPDGGGGIAAETKPERPEWLPSQFDKAEDLAKSYDESRREMNRLQAELKKKDEEFAQVISRIDSAPQHQPGQDPLIAQYEQALANGDAASALAIQIAVTQQATQQMLDKKFQELQPALTAQDEAQRDVAFRMAEDRMKGQYGDRWGELQPQVYQMLKDRPHWLPQAANVDGYASVLGEAASVIEAQRVIAANTAAEADRQAKLAAQGITGSTSRGLPPTDADKAAWKEVQDAQVSSYRSLFGK